MSQPISTEEIRLILEPHVRRFSRSIWPTWERYCAIPPADRLTYDLAAEVKILNRYIIDNVKREFSGLPGVHLIEIWGFALGFEGFGYGIDATVVCRFKKLNEAGESRAYPTGRAIAIRNNDTEKLDGIPDSATMVDIGYVQNQYRTGFREVQAVRVIDTQFIMSFPEAEGGTVVVPLPLFSLTPDERFQIVARREDEKKSGTKE